MLHPERGLKYVLEEARQADLQGYDSVWLGDHLMSGLGSWKGDDGPDGPMDHFTLMTAIGATTSRARLAWSMLNASFRNPALLAKMLATLDRITEGRVICSLGSGSFPDEYAAYDIPRIEDHDERTEHLREVVQLLKQLWTHPAPERTTFEGRYVRVKDLPFNPRPHQQPHPPIWLGGESDATVQIVKDLADGWVTLTRCSKTVRGDAGNKIALAMDADDWPRDRPMTVVMQTRMFAAESRESAVADAVHSSRTTANASPGGYLNSDIVGTPDECLERIAEIEASGPNYIRLTFDDLAQQERVARLVLPRLGEITASPAGGKNGGAGE